MIAFFFFFFFENEQYKELISDLHEVTKKSRQLLPMCDEYEKSCIETRIKTLEKVYEMYAFD